MPIGTKDPRRVVRAVLELAQAVADRERTTPGAVLYLTQLHGSSKRKKGWVLKAYRTKSRDPLLADRKQWITVKDRDEWYTKTGKEHWGGFKRTLGQQTPPQKMFEGKAAEESDIQWSGDAPHFYKSGLASWARFTLLNCGDSAIQKDAAVADAAFKELEQEHYLSYGSCMVHGKPGRAWSHVGAVFL
jgi:hypothetical protein